MSIDPDSNEARAERGHNLARVYVLRYGTGLDHADEVFGKELVKNPSRPGDPLWDEDEVWDTTEREWLSDALVDLYHFADARGIDVGRLADSVHMHYEAETQGR